MTTVIAVIKPACETTAAIKDWQKSKKLIKSEKTDNENGKDGAIFMKN